MTSPAPTRRITPKHAEVLASSAISLEAAQAWGIFSVVSADELPADLAHFVFARGLVFPLRRPDGSVIHQIGMGGSSDDLRRDTPVCAETGREEEAYLQRTGVTGFPVA